MPALSAASRRIVRARASIARRLASTTHYHHYARADADERRALMRLRASIIAPRVYFYHDTASLLFSLWGQIDIWMRMHYRRSSLPFSFDARYATLRASLVVTRFFAFAIFHLLSLYARLTAIAFITP